MSTVTEQRDEDGCSAIDLDLPALWEQFSRLRNGQEAFLSHLRDIVRNPDAIDDVSFCDSCSTPAWSDDLTGTLDGADVCEACLNGHFMWCESCDGYYQDSDSVNHDHNCCCSSPQRRFKVRNDGCEPLANDTKVTIKLPSGAISAEGLTEISRYLDRQAATRDLSYDLASLGDQWQTRAGNYAKRLSRLAYQSYQVKLTPEALSQVGCIARDHCTDSPSVEIEVTRDLNQSAAYFLHEDSCWWGSYGESRCALKTNGGFGLRSFGDSGYVSGRAWVLPLRLATDSLTPTFETLTPDAFVVFNGYGALSGYAAPRILAHMAGWTYRKIDFSCAPMYVNAGGYLVAPEHIAEKYGTALELDLHQHARLFEEEFANV